MKMNEYRISGRDEKYHLKTFLSAFAFEELEREKVFEKMEETEYSWMQTSKEAIGDVEEGEDSFHVFIPRSCMRLKLSDAIWFYLIAVPFAVYAFLNFPLTEFFFGGEGCVMDQFILLFNRMIGEQGVGWIQQTIKWCALFWTAPATFLATILVIPVFIVVKRLFSWLPSFFWGLIFSQFYDLDDESEEEEV